MTCGCDSYDELPLTVEAITRRAKLFKEMRSRLKQIAQRMVQRWVEHYRLYRCESCGACWQATLTTVGHEDAFYLYRVPNLTNAEWLERPFLCPSTLLSSHRQMTQFRRLPHPVSDARCSMPNCDERALAVSSHCLEHHIDNLGAIGVLPGRPIGRCFGRYRAEQFDPGPSGLSTLSSLTEH